MNAPKYTMRLQMGRTIYENAAICLLQMAGRQQWCMLRGCEMRWTWFYLHFFRQHFFNASLVSSRHFLRRNMYKSISQCLYDHWLKSVCNFLHFFRFFLHIFDSSLYPAQQASVIFLQFLIIPASQMICQQVFTVSSKTANHLANTYALEYTSCIGFAAST